MDILDNLNVIGQRDPQDAVSVVANTPEQLIWDAKIENDINDEFIPAKIVLAGMGGSALAGLIAKNWLDLAIPFEIVRDYDLPRYVDAGTLVIASSYSGNTEETLAALDEALLRQATIVVIAAGGKLIDIAKEKGLPFVQLPSGLQPRVATFYGLRAITKLLGAYGIAPESYDEIATYADVATEFSRKMLPSVETLVNPAKTLAIECVGKTPVVYSSSLMSPVAYKWKISFNENAKNVAFWNQLPEFNHNEFIGWTSHPIEKPFAVIDLRSQFDNARIAKRFEISDRLLSGQRPAAKTVNLHGETVLCQMICGSILADFVSIYVAILNNVNPTPVPLIEKLKAELA